MHGHMSIKAERVSVVLGGFRTCGDRRGQVSEIGWQYPPAHPPTQSSDIERFAGSLAINNS